jgi:hypothetical protein
VACGLWHSTRGGQGQGTSAQHCTISTAPYRTAPHRTAPHHNTPRRRAKRMAKRMAKRAEARHSRPACASVMAFPMRAYDGREVGSAWTSDGLGTASESFGRSALAEEAGPNWGRRVCKQTPS